MRRPLALLPALLLPLALCLPSAQAATATATKVPTFDHVVTVFMENETATSTFEAPKATPNLQKLMKTGAYTPQFYGTGHASLDNYLAIFSGQEPVANTKADCLGMPVNNCLYAANVPTLATTMDSKHVTWKSYAEGMNGAEAGHACLHAPTLSLPDPYQGPGTNGYATRHVPPMWFNSVLQKGGNEDYCKAHVVDLTELATDAKATTTLPQWSFVTPDTCHDGHDTSASGGCTIDPEGPNAPSGVAAIDAWLPGFVKDLTTSKAWTPKSLLIITFDEALTTAADGCKPCNDKSAGGRIGALFIGGQVKPGFRSAWVGDQYGLLRTYEDAFGLPTLKSISPNPAMTHDGDPGVKPVLDIWKSLAVSTPTKVTTPTTTTNRPPTKPAGSGAGLPTTGLSIALPTGALLLIAVALLHRRRRAH